MSDPVLHVIAGPNGAGKTTFFRYILEPATKLEFVNADAIAEDRWPDDAEAHASEAGAIAAAERARRLQARTSFVAGTVFSHESKVELVEDARSHGYLVTLHIIMIPEDLAVARVASRVEDGGHGVAERKVRDRHQRLWAHLRRAIDKAHEVHIYDNSKAVTPFTLVATYRDGALTATTASWPEWTPPELREPPPEA